MPGTYLPALLAILTPQRVGSCRLPGESDLQALARYVWNAELGQSLYSSLHLLEIGLRNKLDVAIASREGPLWYDDPNVVVQPDGQAAVANAKSRLIREGKTVTPGGVVATLDFGFWTTLFHRTYEQPPKGPGWRPLWPMLLPAVAPGRARRQLSGRLNELRKLRNRIFHYEPIWRGMAGKPLHQIHVELLEAVGWIDADLRRTAVLLDSFPETLQAGHAWRMARLTLLDS